MTSAYEHQQASAINCRGSADCRTSAQANGTHRSSPHSVAVIDNGAYLRTTRTSIGLKASVGLWPAGLLW